MNKVTSLHKQAMSAMDSAIASRKAGELEVAHEQLHRAFTLEAEAANELLTDLSAEPSRAILYRSAASLAIQCKRYADAEKLIYRALAGQPSVSIEQELHALLENASFSRHLILRGITLSNIDVQVALEGDGIGFGIAPASAVLPRVESTNLLLFRTAERLDQRAYRESGPPTDQVRERAETFMTVPRAASYAFSLRIGSLEQMSFEDPSEHLIDELLDCLTLIESRNAPELKEKIPDPAYYNNFVALAQSILPDGERVRTVGFTVQRASGVRQLALRQTAAQVRDEFLPIITSVTKRRVVGKERPIQLSGQLRLADSINENNRIQVVSREGRATTVYVPEGLMADIVKPLWDEWVTVDGLKMGRTITLLKIERSLI